MKTLCAQLKRAKARSVPLVAVGTADQPAAALLVAEAEKGRNVAVVGWDSIRGPHPLNERGKEAVTALCQAAGGIDPAALTDWPSMSYCTAAALPEDATLVIYNAHLLVVGNDALRGIQGVMNLRDKFAANGRMLVLMAPSWSTPVELGTDVLVLDDPLPTPDERSSLAAPIIESAKEGGVDINADDETIRAIVDMTRGLSRFAVEQTVSLSVDQTGLNREQLQSRFVTAVNDTPGLTFEPEPTPIESIGGLENFKSFAKAVSGGRAKPEAVVFVDEIEKALAGSSGAAQDTSGTSQGILGQLLTWMEDNQATGLIALGPPGCLSGETELIYRRGTRNSGRRIKLADLYLKFNEIPVEPHAGMGRQWHSDCSTLLQSYHPETGRVFFNKVRRVISSGVKPCLEMRLSTGECIKLTADHRVMTEDGFVAAGELSVGSTVVCRGSMLPQGRKQRTKKIYRNRVVVEGLKHYASGWIKRVQDRTSGKIYEYRRQNRARLVVEASMNAMLYDEYVSALKADPNAVKLQVLPSGLDVHHKNGDSMDDRLENLQVLTVAEHRKVHDVVERFHADYTQVATVESITPCGEEETYDIEMSDPAHNFSTAAGLFVHNSGKSMSAKALGGVLDVPTIRLDVGSLKGSLVGESERNTRAALKALKSLAGRTFWIATCNSEVSLPPELRRRFKQGVWFFDLPSAEERETIWELYLTKHELPLDSERPNDEGWTGAEIKACVESAWSLNVPLTEAAQWIVPVAKSAAEAISSLRRNAAGRYISASNPGAYEYVEIEAQAPTGKRKFDFDS